jgi:hypothetical protein
VLPLTSLPVGDAEKKTAHIIIKTTEIAKIGKTAGIRFHRFIFI